MDDTSVLADAIGQTGSIVNSRTIKHDPSGIAHVINSFRSLSGMLFGMQHVVSFIFHRNRYGTIVNTSKTPVQMILYPTFMDGIQTEGQLLMKRLVQRIDWALQLFVSANKPFDSSVMVNVLETDVEWIRHCQEWMRTTRLNYDTFINHNRCAYQEFSALNRNGMYDVWPHCKELLTRIESSGFTFSPTMVQKDRIVCKECRNELSGFQPWNRDTWKFHRFDLHTPEFVRKARDHTKKRVSLSADAKHGV
jgi:hypothetical protein